MKRTSILLMTIMLLCMFGTKASAFTNALDTQDTWTVVGVNSLFGSSWDPTDSNNDMTLVDGLYTWTKNDVALRYNVEYKIVKNHGWDESYPNTGYSNYTIPIDKAGMYNVTITFNAETKESNAVAEFVKEIELPLSTWTIAGYETLFGSSWDTMDSNNDMTFVGGLYTWTKNNVTLDNKVEFKIVKDHGWDEAYPSSNYVINLDKAGIYNVTITFNAETKEINVVTELIKEVDVDHTYSVAGDATMLLGSSWDPTVTNNDMVKNPETGQYVFVRENISMPAGVYYYKIVQDHSWSVSYPDGYNNEFWIPETSNYNITITFDPTTKEINSVVENLNREERDFSMTFRTDLGWEKVYAYAWRLVDGKRVFPVEYPGVDITDTQSNGVYTYSYRATVPVDGVIFNNGVGGENSAVNAVFLNGQLYEFLLNTWTVCGQSEELFGTNWTNNDPNNDMKLVDGLYIWTKKGVVLSPGLIRFRVVKNHSWSEGYPSSPYEVYINEAGLYDVTITFDANTKQISWTAVKDLNQPYAVLSDDNTILTFYYDEHKAERNGMDAEGGWSVPWQNMKDNITTVVFDESFADCESLNSTKNWFYNCTSLTTISGIQNLNTLNVTDMSYMFNLCTNLATVDFSNFNTSNVTDMSYMFSLCRSLTGLDLSNFSTSNVINMSGMFSGCSSLQTIYAGNDWSIEKVADGENMFYECTSLVGGKGTVYDAEKTGHSYAHIDGGVDNPGYLTDKMANYIPLHPTDGVSVGARYNLNGQRINSPAKGLNIINGRKVVIK